MRTITGGGALTRQNITDINNNFVLAQLPFTPGNVIWLNPASNNTQAQDGSQSKPFTDLPTAYSAATAGNNDIILLVANGTTAATARIESAFTWAKNETHLIGYCAPVLYSQRARLAPSSTTTAFANFFTVSASGCIFQNIQWFDGFTTGTTAQIAVTVTGSRNFFSRCQFAGMGDAASAADTGSRSLKVGSAGSGENVFEDCVIGLDTVARSVANASLELAGATPRNAFRRCIFPFQTSNAGVLGILGTGNGCVDRGNTFEDCTFVNDIKSTSTQMSVLASFTTASPGGALVFKNCMMMGITKFGDTNGLANSYIDMPAVSASAGGLGVNPS